MKFTTARNVSQSTPVLLHTSATVLSPKPNEMPNRDRAISRRPLSAIMSLILCRGKYCSILAMQN